MLTSQQNLSCNCLRYCPSRAACPVGRLFFDQSTPSFRSISVTTAQTFFSELSSLSKLVQQSGSTSISMGVFEQVRNIYWMFLYSKYGCSTNYFVFSFNNFHNSCHSPLTSGCQILLLTRCHLPLILFLVFYRLTCYINVVVLIHLGKPY